MVGVMTGVCRDFEAVLRLVAVMAMFVLPATHGICPAVNQHCSCRRDSRISSNHSNIFCEDMGNILQVPPFNPSETTYFLLKIGGDTTLLTLQAGAFKGINIRGLELSGLGITTVKPGAFAGIGSMLSYVTLDHNHIETIPDDAFMGIKYLSGWVTLAYNRLNTVGSSVFSNMPGLRGLYLDNNQLDVLSDDTFNGLSALNGLYLRNNRLTTVGPAMFSQLKRLQHLYLGGNRFETIPDDTFKALSNLWLLSLDGIHMTTMSSALFQNLSHLERLSIKHNQIDTIPDNAFDGLTQLRELHLSYNRLSSVNPVMISQLPVLQRLYLYGNPLVCDCDLVWLRRTTTISLKDKPVCSSPLRVRGTLVTSFDISMCSPDIDTTTESKTTDNPIDVGTTLIQEAYVTTVGKMSTTKAYVGTTRSGGTNDSSKGHEQLLMIVIGTLTAALVLVFGVLVYTYRMKCREVDPYTHNRPESRATACTIYDTIAAPVPVY